MSETTVCNSRSVSGEAPSGAVAVGLFALVFAFSIGFVPVFNDDAYITARYARNLAAGNGFVYNLGEHVLGTTSPLLTMILATAMLPLPDEIALRLVAAAMFSLCSVSFYYYGCRFGQPAAGLAAAIIFPSVDWNVMFAGNETPLFTALFLLTLILMDRGNFYWAGLAVGFLALTRGEGLIFGPLIGLLALRGHGIRGGIRFASCFLCVTVPWFLFSRFYFGEWFPRTLAMKKIQVTNGLWPQYSPWEYPLKIWLRPASIYGLVAWFGLPGLFRRAGRPLVLWALIHSIVYRRLGVAHFQWYHYPLVAATIWSVSCALEMIGMGAVRFARRQAKSTIAASPPPPDSERRFSIGTSTAAVGACALSLALSWSCWDGRVKKIIPDDYIRLRYERYIQMSDYLGAHLSNHDTIMLYEIGIIGFRVWPTDVRDLLSLIHRDIPGDRIGDVNGLVFRFKPEWFVSADNHGRNFAAIHEPDIVAYERRFNPTDWNPLHQSGAPTLYRRLDQPPSDWKFGLNDPENLKGVDVRRSEGAADLEIPRGASRIRIKFWLAHPDLPKNPARITFRVGETILGSIEINSSGPHEFVGDVSKLEGPTRQVRVELSRQAPPSDGKPLQVAVYPIEAVQ